MLCGCVSQRPAAGASWWANRTQKRQHARHQAAFDTEVPQFALCGAIPAVGSSCELRTAACQATSASQADADMKHVVQKFCPAFVFHPKEQYFVCTPEYFVDSCKLVKQTGKDSAEQVLSRKDTTWDTVNDLTSKASFDDGYRMLIDNKKDRVGMASSKLSEVPLFAKLKKVKLQSGEVIIEINYMALFAFSGPYKTFFGEHDGDWEHITVRCTTDGSLIAVYYSAHRHQDGTWLPAKQCPVDENTGRLLCFVCLNGHAIYSTTGVHKRPETYYLANDETSSRGRLWACKECIILAYPGGQLTDGKVTMGRLGPVLADRGCVHVAGHDGELPLFSPPLKQTADDPVAVADIKVSVPGTEWLHWKCRWGTVIPPWKAKWYTEGEHPTGRQNK